MEKVEHEKWFQEHVVRFADELRCSTELSHKLIMHGINSLAAMEGVEHRDLLGLGLTSKESQEVMRLFAIAVPPTLITSLSPEQAEKAVDAFWRGDALTPRTDAHIHWQNESVPPKQGDEALRGWCSLSRALEHELTVKDAGIAKLEKDLLERQKAYVDNLPNGEWIDQWGSCRVCGGEIPYGHTESCDYYKQEKQIMALKTEIETLRRYGNKDCTTMADEALARSE